MYVGRSSLQIERDYGKRLSRLIREGFEVHVLAGDDGGFADLDARGVVCKPIPVERKLNVAGLLGAYFIVQAYFIEEKPVLVHAFDDVLAWVGAFAAHRAHVDAVFATVHRHAFVEDPVRLEIDTLLPVPPKFFEGVEAFLNNIVDAPVRNGLYRAYAYLGEIVDKYFVINEHDFGALQDLELVPPDKLEMIIGGDGVDLDRFPVDDDDFPSISEARRELGLPEHWRHVFGYVGPFSLPRGATDLLACIEQVAQTHPAAGWVVNIDGGVSDVLLRRLERLEEKGRVVIRRRMDDLAMVYRALDAFVMPSYREGAPTHLMEAAACGVGAITYNLPATQSAVEHGQTGELIPLGEVDVLVDSLRRALDDPTRLENYGLRSRTRAVRRFNRQHVEDQVFRMYDTVLEVKLHGAGL
jgi:glycosyltransferase involved in cell wall biosynthesis